jgi:hypothetical protein
MVDSNASSPLTNPPKPALAFRVGVVGHRPNRLTQADLPALAAVVGSLLSACREAVTAFHQEHPDLHAPDAPILRAVTPLAEGTDRLFAEQAVSRGYQLVCPFPFPQSEYEADFAPGKALEADSLDRFRRLLGGPHPVTTFELDGTRAMGGDAYGAAGRVVLNQSDLLIAVWDGQPAAGPGGTVETVSRAVAYRVPVIWIDAHAPHPWAIGITAADLAEAPTMPGQTSPPRRVPAGGASIARVKQLVDSLVALPPPAPPGPAARTRHKPAPPSLRARFFAETKPRVNFGMLWKPFRDGVGLWRWRRPEVGVREFERAVAADWPTTPGELDAKGLAAIDPKRPPVAFWVNARLRSYYAWSDKLADYYGDAYRSSYVLAYFLTVLAVCFALLPLAVPEDAVGWEVAFIAFEFIAVTMLIAIVWLGHHRRWHERWLEYRLVAELVRQVRCLVPLGGGRPFPRQAEHLRGYEDPTSSWMYWYVRAIHRATGLPRLSMTQPVLRECLTYLDGVVEGQIRFHDLNAERSEHLEERLHVAGIWLFAMTAAAVAIHFLPHVLGWGGVHLEWPRWFSRTLTVACGAFPAMGGALAAVKNHGEFLRLAKRSAGMSAALGEVRLGIEAALAAGARPTAAETTELAAAVARVMVDEVLDWRVMFEDRPLTDAMR